MSLEENKTEFAFSKQNYIILAAGFLILIIGFMLMMGGESHDPNVFNGEELFSIRRITIAPIVVIAGFITILWSIMKKAKQ